MVAEKRRYGAVENYGIEGIKRKRGKEMSNVNGCKERNVMKG